MAALAVALVLRFPGASGRSVHSGLSSDVLLASISSSGSSPPSLSRPSVRQGVIVPRQSALPESGGPGYAGVQKKRSRGPLKGTVFTADSTNEDVTHAIDELLTRDDRTSFIAKVYMILSVQLLTTASIVAAVHTFKDEAIRIIFRTDLGPFILGASILGSLATHFLLMFFPAKRLGPNKYKYLTAFTLFESLMVAASTLRFPSRMVLNAATSTGLATAAVSAFAIKNNNPKYDLTQMGQGLFSFAVLLLGECLRAHLALGSLAHLRGPFLPFFCYFA